MTNEGVTLRIYLHARKKEVEIPAYLWLPRVAYR